jgi:hypothetical protein
MQGEAVEILTVSPTEWGNFRQVHRRPSAVGILKRVGKKLRTCATIFDGNHRRNG